MLPHPTHDRLIALGLVGMAKAFEEQRQQPAGSSLTFEERLGLLVDREAVERESRRLVTRLKFANLRQNATIEELNTKAARGLDALALARGDGRYARLLKSLARVELLILDDWGLAPLTSQQGRDLLEIVDDRHGRGSTIVTSQLPVDHWHEVIVDPTIADAVLDRLVHTAHRLALDGETLRKPPEKSAKRGKLDTDNAE